jgi:toxin ParE1/3/4
MARQLLITPRAEQDLTEIWAYIADDSPTSATQLVERIEGKFKPLLTHPGLGTAREELAEGLRMLPYKAYVIYYTFDDAAVTIQRVLHGARDVRTFF